MKNNLLNEEIYKIKLMMGIINENDSLNDDKPSYLKPCKKCIKTYNGLLGDNCIYEAIERFEENYGTAQGTSMGNDYFESNWKKFDDKIVKRVINSVGNIWANMDSKFKMQLWSFMYNSDSGNNDLYRWLAVLYVTANDEIKTFDSKITSKITNKNDINEWNKAIKLVSKYNGWNSKYSKFLEMIDGQYKTYSNKGAYTKSWSFRPLYMGDMYDECNKK